MFVVTLHSICLAAMGSFFIGTFWAFHAFSIIFPFPELTSRGYVRSSKGCPRSGYLVISHGKIHGNITILICKSNFRGQKSKERCRETSTPMISIHIVYRMMAPSYVGWFITPFFFIFHDLRIIHQRVIVVICTN